MAARQVAVGDDEVPGEIGRRRARGAQPVGDAPEMEMFERALGEVLPLGNVVVAAPPLDQRAGDPAQPEIDGERQTHRPAADDGDLTAPLRRPAARRRRQRQQTKALAVPVPASER